MSVLISRPSTPPHQLTKYHPDSLSARISSPRSSTSRFFRWPPVDEPESPSPNVGRKKFMARLRDSPSPEPRPSKLIRQQDSVTDDFEYEINSIFESYKQTSERSLYMFKDDLLHALRNANIPKSDIGNAMSLLDDVKERRMLHFEAFANSDVVPWDSPTNILDYITAALGQAPISKAPPLVWLPPDFYNAESYCFQACMDDTNVVDFGFFDNEPIQATMEGSVVCWSEDHFSGRGVMSFEGRSNRVDIQVVVLGGIICTGTALLLDAVGRIWLYNVPGAVDPYLEGTPGQATSVTLPEKGMSKYTELRFGAKHENVDVIVKDREY